MVVFPWRRIIVGISPRSERFELLQERPVTVMWQDFFRGLLQGGPLRYLGVASAEVVSDDGTVRRININDKQYIRCIDRLLPVVETTALEVAPLERFVITVDAESAMLIMDDPEKFAMIFHMELLRQQLSTNIILSEYVSGPPAQLTFMRSSPATSTPP